MATDILSNFVFVLFVKIQQPLRSCSSIAFSPDRYQYMPDSLSVQAKQETGKCIGRQQQRGNWLPPGCIRNHITGSQDHTGSYLQKTFSIWISLSMSRAWFSCFKHGQLILLLLVVLNASTHPFSPLTTSCPTHKFGTLLWTWAKRNKSEWPRCFKASARAL